MQYMYLDTGADLSPGCPADKGSCGREVWLFVREGSGIIESLYCKQHTCRSFDDGSLCGRPKGLEGKYCLHHIQCAASIGPERCPNHVQDDNASRYRYCREHHACVEAQCRNPRDSQNNSRYCRAHRCPTEGCADRHGSPHACESVQSPRHAARRCETSGCGQPVPVGRFCAVHVCDEAGCEMARAGGIFCEGHARRRGRDDGRAGYAFRWRHARRDEALPDRRNAENEWQGRVSLSASDSFDAVGLCRAQVDPRGCMAPAEPGTCYCVVHLCLVRTCAGPREGMYDYCARHRCCKADCHRLRRRNRSGQGNDVHSFCDLHDCWHDGDYPDPVAAGDVRIGGIEIMRFD